MASTAVRDASSRPSSASVHGHRVPSDEGSSVHAPCVAPNARPPSDGVHPPTPNDRAPRKYQGRVEQAPPPLWVAVVAMRRRWRFEALCMRCEAA